MASFEYILFSIYALTTPAVASGLKERLLPFFVQKRKHLLLNHICLIPNGACKELSFFPLWGSSSLKNHREKNTSLATFSIKEYFSTSGGYRSAKPLIFFYHGIYFSILNNMLGLSIGTNNIAYKPNS